MYNMKRLSDYTSSSSGPGEGGGRFFNNTTPVVKPDGAPVSGASVAKAMLNPDGAAEYKILACVSSLVHHPCVL